MEVKEYKNEIKIKKRREHKKDEGENIQKKEKKIQLRLTKEYRENMK